MSTPNFRPRRNLTLSVIKVWTMNCSFWAYEVRTCFRGVYCIGPTNRSGTAKIGNCSLNASIVIYQIYWDVWPFVKYIIMKALAGFLITQRHMTVNWTHICVYVMLSPDDSRRFLRQSPFQRQWQIVAENGDYSRQWVANVDRLSSVHNVTENGDCRRFLRQSPFSATNCRRNRRL